MAVARARDQRGSTVVEVVVLGPAVMTFVLLMLAIGSAASARHGLQVLVDQAAVTAARTGQLRYDTDPPGLTYGAQLPSEMRARAVAVLEAVAGSDISADCIPGSATSHITLPPAGSRGGTVTVSVSCKVGLPIGLPGADRTIEVGATGVAVVDERRDADNMRGR